MQIPEHLKNNWGKYLAGAGATGLIGSEIHDPVLTSNVSGLAKNLYNIGQADILPEEDANQYKDYSWKQFINNIKHWDSANFDKPAAQYNVYNDGTTAVESSLANKNGPFKFVTHDESAPVSNIPVEPEPKKVIGPGEWTEEDQAKLDAELNKHKERMNPKPTKLPVVPEPKEDIMTKEIQEPKPLSNFKSNIILPKVDLANGESSLKSRLEPSINKLKEFGNTMEDLKNAQDPNYVRFDDGSYHDLPKVLVRPERQQAILARLAKINKI